MFGKNVAIESITASISSSQNEASKNPASNNLCKYVHQGTNVLNFSG